VPHKNILICGKTLTNHNNVEKNSFRYGSL